MSLRVIQAFAGFSVGDLIDDAEEVGRVLASEQAHFVIALPDTPKEPESVTVAKAAGKLKSQSQ